LLLAIGLALLAAVATADAADLTGDWSAVRSSTHNVLGPAGAWWVRDRVEGAVEVCLDHEVTAARAADGGVRLEVAASDGGERDAVLVTCEAGVEREAARRALPPGPVRLGVEARGYDLRFHAGPELVGAVSGEPLSDEVAGGFFGTLVGVFATGRGSTATIEWFEYAPLPEG